MKKLVIFIVIMLLNINCSDTLVKSENHNAIIRSLTVFPEVVKPKDSLIVVCDAFDPDGDTLVYDWYTVSVVKIKGIPSWDCCALYNSPENSQIFYAPDSQFVATPLDTFWIECTARDGKGGGSVQTVIFTVKNDSV
jgi:hypothetical protein